MKNSFYIAIPLLVFFSINPLLIPLQSRSQKSEITAYKIDVNIIPAAKFLEASAEITVKGLEDNINKIRIFIHEDFKIKKMLFDDKPLDFTVNKLEEDKMMYSPTGIPIDIELIRPLSKNETQNIELHYSGEIKTVINDVNMISDHLTEIAGYCSWYPLMKGSRSFSYSLTVTLPSNQICVTDGDLINEEEKEGKITRFYKREREGMDIPVLASDLFKIKRREAAEIQASIYYRQLKDSLADEMLTNAVNCARFYSEKFGKPLNKGKLIMISSPRAGWGYSRVPLIVGPENYFMRLLESDEGRIENFHGSAHEIAHFWWMLTDSQTSDNWIDEALAEFSSLLAVEHFFGRAKVDGIFKKYQSDILRISNAKPILDTLRNERTAYVLYYEKGSLIFEMLREILGEYQLIEILKEFYSLHKGKSEAVIQDLINLFSSACDINLKPFFNQFLNTNELPNVIVTWRSSVNNTVDGSITLENGNLPRFPLEITFIQVEKRKIDLYPGENKFKFRLPFNPDLIIVDEKHKLLKAKTEIKK